MNKVLVIAPHMDDEALGCGGTIAKHVAQKDVVHVCFIAHRIYNHRFDKAANEREKGHARQAVKMLGCEDAIFLDLNDERLDACLQDIIIPLEAVVAKIKPNIVYGPFRGDNNQDHRAVFDAMRVALRPSATPFIQKVMMYEVPSSTDQSPALPENAFTPNYHIDISKHMEKKLKAFKCYKTEDRKFPHPRSAEAIRVLAQKRGVEAGVAYAEGFMILRERWV